MRRSFLRFVIFAFPFALGGCAQNADFIDGPMKEVSYIRTINACSSPETRVSITPGTDFDAVCWKEGDRLLLFEVGASGFTGECSTFKLSEGAGTDNAIFVPVSGDNGIVAGNDYVAVHSGTDAILAKPAAGGTIKVTLPQVVMQREDNGKFYQVEDNVFYCSQKFSTDPGQTTIPNVAMNSFMSVFEIQLEAADGFTPSEDFKITSMGVKADAACFGNSLSIDHNGNLAEATANSFKPNFSVNIVGAQKLSAKPCARMVVWWNPTLMENQNLTFYAATPSGKIFKREVTNNLASDAGKTKVIKISATAEPVSEMTPWNGSYDDADTEVPGGFTAFNQQDKNITISNAAQLAWLSAKVNDGINNFSNWTITQTEDIDLASHPWAPIGHSNRNFRGIYDGNGYKIYNLNITETSAQNNVGLFGACTAVSCELRNITIESGSIISSQANVGGIAGYINSGAKIYRCINRADITTTGNSRTGGIVAYFQYNSAAPIALSHCVNYGNISGGSRIGGIVAQYINSNQAAETAEFSNNTNYGKITTSAAADAAGIIGNVELNSGYTAIINNCANYGEVISNNGNAAGVVAFISLKDTGTAGAKITLTACKNEGTVSSKIAGGIVGMAGDNKYDAGYNTNISNCRNSGLINGVAGNKGGILAYANYNSRLLIRDCDNSGSVIQELDRGDAVSIAGGIVGLIPKKETMIPAIVGCRNTGMIMTNIESSAVSGTVGGIVGQMYQGILTNCYSEGIVKATGSRDRVAGIAAAVEGTAMLVSANYSNCNWAESSDNCAPVIYRMVAAEENFSRENNYTTHPTKTETGTINFADSRPDGMLPGWGTTPPANYSVEDYGAWECRWNPITLGNVGGYPKLTWE